MKTTSLKPLGGRVLVKPFEEEQEGSIYIPDSAKEKPQKGVVVDVGTGKLNEKGVRLDFNVKVGDKVLVSKYGGSEITIGEEKFLLIEEENILGILD